MNTEPWRLFNVARVTLHHPRVSIGFTRPTMAEIVPSANDDLTRVSLFEVFSPDENLALKIDPKILCNVVIETASVTWDLDGKVRVQATDVNITIEPPDGQPLWRDEDVCRALSPDEMALADQIRQEQLAYFELDRTRMTSTNISPNMAEILDSQIKDSLAVLKRLKSERRVGPPTTGGA